MHNESFRKDFPITEKYAFFNHAAVSPLPRPAVEALENYIRESSCNGLLSGQAWQTLGAVKALLGEKLNCSPDDIAMTQNTTAGISFIANGLDWQPGDNVVLANIEYPANVYPWWAQEQRGVELKFVQPESGRVPLENYYAAVDSRTRVLAVSHVQFSSGYRADLDALGEFCEERGILFVVDAIQSVGALPVDVQKSKISALACGVHKWLMCPPGLGFFYCQKELAERLKVWSPGAMSVENPFDFLDYGLDYAPGAKRFENGSVCLISAYALEAVLKMMKQAGETEIQEKIKLLTDHLCNGLRQKAYGVFSPRDNDEWSGIVVFEHEEHPADQLVEHLQKNGVITSLRGGRVRVAPHYYNTEAEIDRLCELLP